MEPEISRPVQPIASKVFKQPVEREASKRRVMVINKRRIFQILLTTWSLDQDWMQSWRRSSSFKDPLHHLSSHASSSLTAADPLMSQHSAISAFFA